ncbi:MAG: OstA-like protein [Bacteroidota bacterium]|nr:OstA-like protein [Bacteroidota bacterium]
MSIVTRVIVFSLKILKKYIATVFILFIFQNINGQSEVQIIGGERLTINQAKRLTVIAENVVIKHNGVTIQCDSAIRKTDLGIIEGFGNVYIFQPDTFTLSGGDYLKYDESSKTAIVTGKNVVLRDAQMTLQTTSILYNTLNQTGFYTNGADIQNGSNNLKSKKGYYFRRSNVFNFKDNVVLTSPDYVMYSDTLEYFSGSKIAYFFGPTKIVSEENIIHCNYGWYNTKTEKAQFSKKASIISGANTIFADSLLYDKKKGEGRGIGNIKLIDTIENFEVYGQHGLYYQKSKETWVTQNPLAIKKDETDTMYILADTFYYINDTLNKTLKAYYNTAIIQKEFQGKCDSLVYQFNDSLISLFHSPILWSKENQIVGDTMFILLKNKKMHRLKVMNNAFLASEVKSGYYNQIAGDYMNNLFTDNKLDQVLVEGNSEIIYYIRDNETDSAEYTGVNKEKCHKMLIFFDSSRVSNIRFYGKPVGKIYPIKEFPESEKHLENLSWKVDQKPVIDTFLERKKEIKKSFALPSKSKESPINSKKKLKPKKISK